MRKRNFIVVSLLRIGNDTKKKFSNIRRLQQPQLSSSNHSYCHLCPFSRHREPIRCRYHPTFAFSWIHTLRIRLRQPCFRTLPHCCPHSFQHLRPLTLWIIQVPQQTVSIVVKLQLQLTHFISQSLAKTDDIVDRPTCQEEDIRIHFQLKHHISLSLNFTPLSVLHCLYCIINTVENWSEQNVHSLNIRIQEPRKIVHGPLHCVVYINLHQKTLHVTKKYVKRMIFFCASRNSP